MQRMGTNNSISFIKHMLFIALLVVTVFSCEKKSQPMEEGKSTELVSETISIETFTEKLAAEHGAIILDVRTPPELADGYIEGATNIDFKAANFKDKISTLDKEATYFVYCASGGRSRNAADLMKELQFKKVYDIAGGFNGWKSKGLPFTLPSE